MPSTGIGVICHMTLLLHAVQRTRYHCSVAYANVTPTRLNTTQRHRAVRVTALCTQHNTQQSSWLSQTQRHTAQHAPTKNHPLVCTHILYTRTCIDSHKSFPPQHSWCVRLGTLCSHCLLTDITLRCWA